MIAQIIELLLTIFSTWPQRQADSTKKSYAEWRNGYAKAKEDRARRAALADADSVLRNGENKS